MARKKKTDSGAKKVDASHVKGLRAEVLEQPIVELYALCDERHHLPGHSGD